MQIDWVHFTPASALAGGVVIGLAAGLLILLLGRIAGVSGILAGLAPPRAGDLGWRVAFLLGLFVAPVFGARLFGTQAPDFGAAGAPLLAVAGVLVGFGSRLAGGCTSGHGVCGLSRLSPRSLAATATFMAVAVVTVFIMRHVVA